MSVSHLPRLAHNPTPEEKREQIEQYRIKPNRGYIIEDRGTKANRQPTHDEATQAVNRSIDYHARNMAVLKTLATGNKTGEYNKLKIGRGDNEWVAAKWKQSGAKRAQLVEKEHANGPLDLNPGPSEPPKTVYDPRDPDSVARVPRNEPVNMKGMNGVDKVVEMQAVTHPPPFDDCVRTPVYNEHREHDTIPVMEDSERIHPGRKGNGTDLDVSQCRLKCNGDADCLGYVETYANPLDTECWTIPKSKFPNGDVKMHPWIMGSTFVKTPPPPLPAHCANGATGYTGPRELPKSDFGPVVKPITELTAVEEQNLKAHEAAFMSSEMKGLDEHDDPDQVFLICEMPTDCSMQVDVTRAHTVVERQEKARLYYDERKSKILEKHNSEALTRVERAKKKAIINEAAASTASERAEKKVALDNERNGKKAIAERDAEAKAQEVAFKQTPEGQLEETQRIAAAEAQYAKQKEEQDIYLSSVDAISQERREKDAAKDAAAQVNVTKALEVVGVYKNETKDVVAAGGNESQIVVGDNVYKAMTYLEERGVPYLD